MEEEKKVLEYIRKEYAPREDGAMHKKIEECLLSLGDEEVRERVRDFVDHIKTRRYWLPCWKGWEMCCELIIKNKGHLTDKQKDSMLRSSSHFIYGPRIVHIAGHLISLVGKKEVLSLSDKDLLKAIQFFSVQIKELEVIGEQADAIKKKLNNRYEGKEGYVDWLIRDKLGLECDC